MTNTKQVKITKLFRKGATKVPEDCQELQEEIQNLEQQLREKHNELFQIQRNKYRKKPTSLKNKSEDFVRPQKIMLQNSIATIKRNLELMSMVSGMKVQSYEAGDHCYIIYHLQHDVDHQIKHSLEIDLKSGKNKIGKCSFPLGFNFKTVIEDFDNVMEPICLCSIRKALLAYYDRLSQLNALKKLLNVNAQLFNTLDSSHIEISFYAQKDVESERVETPLVLTLDYKIYSVRPTFRFNDTDLSEDVSEVLYTQCVVFKNKPLHKAFKQAFMDGIGPYSLWHQLKPEERKEQPSNKRIRLDNGNYNNDDTFLPQDCSDQSEDDDYFL